MNWVGNEVFCVMGGKAFLNQLDGGAEGSRTPDLLIANETLYQLSYDPIQLTVNRLRDFNEA